MTTDLLFNLFIDCEATQPAVDDAGLGERAVRGIAELLDAHRLPGTFHVIPGDAEAMPGLYVELRDRGHEVGLHVHPAAQGYAEFLGLYGPDDQRRIVGEAKDRVEQALGFGVHTFCPGYGSSNDYTYGVLEELGLLHGVCKIPSRVLPQCASVHAGAPLGVHYANRFNRVLPGDMDFVDIPMTVDPDSRMWGGQHPQDLRIELVDAKNHWYTMHKSVQRQLAEQATPLYLRAITHNVFEYGDPNDFRRQTLTGVIERAKKLAADAGLRLVGATADEIARRFRAAVPKVSVEDRYQLDRRGHAGAVSAAAV